MHFSGLQGIGGISRKKTESKTNDPLVTLASVAAKRGESTEGMCRL